MRRRKLSFTYALKSAAKYAVAVVTVCALALQPCFTIPAFAISINDADESNYPYWDDPDYGYNWRDDAERRLTNITRAYDDGTKYTAEYKYDTQGNMTNANIKDANGNKTTVTRVFNEGRLTRSTLFEYDVSYQTESTRIIEYGNEQTPTHKTTTTKYSDKTTDSMEVWYYDEYSPLKKITIDQDGTTTQTENTYNDRGQPLTAKTTSSNGDENAVEWQYDEEGEAIYYKGYEYLASQKSKETTETRRDGDKKTGTFHSINSKISEGGGEIRTEAWYRASDDDPIKIIITNPDGSQSTEEYSYNMEGDETLYTKTVNGQIEERRETVHSKDGTTTTYTDRNGNHHVTIESYDVINQVQTEERTITYADGSSSYSKESYSYITGEFLTQIRRTKAADGTETYKESITDSDGTTTIKEKSSDGTTSTTIEDAQGNTISKNTTMPDGTKAETSYEYNTDGQIVREITKYSDGSEDRDDYEYDENGNMVKSKETRRNGITAISLSQKSTDGRSETNSMTFNNGYVLTIVEETMENGTQISTYTYSHGEVSQDIITIAANYIVTMKTIYRDGRVEEDTININEGMDDYYAYYGMMEKISAHIDGFVELAWTILPNQPEPAPQTATPSEGTTAAASESL